MMLLIFLSVFAYVNNDAYKTNKKKTPNICRDDVPRISKASLPRCSGRSLVTRTQWKTRGDRGPSRSASTPDVAGRRRDSERR